MIVDTCGIASFPARALEFKDPLSQVKMILAGYVDSSGSLAIATRTSPKISIAKSPHCSWVPGTRKYFLNIPLLAATIIPASSGDEATCGESQFRLA